MEGVVKFEVTADISLWELDNNEIKNDWEKQGKSQQQITTMGQRKCQEKRFTMTAVRWNIYRGAIQLQWDVKWVV